VPKAHNVLVRVARAWRKPQCASQISANQYSRSAAPPGELQTTTYRNVRFLIRGNVVESRRSSTTSTHSNGVTQTMTDGSDSTVSRVKTSVPALATRLALSTALAFSGTALAQQCKPVSGTILVTSAGPCATGACLHGIIEGDLTGEFSSSLTSLQPTPEQAGTIKFTATSTVSIKSGGTVITTDIGVGTGCTTLLGPCASSHEVLTIISGTGPYAQAYGTIILSGPYMAGQLGEYRGHICFPKSQR
jgi:hypothetical protein